MKKVFLPLYAALFLSVPFAAQAADKSVSTDGSTSMEKVIGSLGEAFSQKNKDISFTYNPTGSSAGISAAMEGRADIGLSSRALKDDESQKLDSTILAYDGIVIVVNKNNKIDDLSLEQVGKIFRGEIKNWKELGGQDKAIVLIGREAGSGTRDGFESITETKGQCNYRQELTATGDVITTVAGNDNAIGYASLASKTKKVKILNIDGVKPDHDTIASGQYKIQRPFVMVTAKDKKLSDSAKAFIDYAMSEEGRAISVKAGVIPASNK